MLALPLLVLNGCGSTAGVASQSSSVAMAALQGTWKDPSVICASVPNSSASVFKSYDWKSTISSSTFVSAITYYSGTNCTTPLEVEVVTVPYSIVGGAADGIGFQVNTYAQSTHTITPLTSAAAVELNTLNSSGQSGFCPATFTINVALDTLTTACNVKGVTGVIPTDTVAFLVYKIDTSTTPNRLYSGTLSSGGLDGSTAAKRPTTYDMMSFLIRQ